MKKQSRQRFIYKINSTRLRKSKWDLNINIEEVFELPRLSKGKKILGVLKGDTIIDIKEVTK